jgi:dTDP-4-amino-4,6-dideoxygalactose transaminase
MAAIQAFADAHGLTVIEDACQAHGARLGDRRAGALGNSAAFSFYPSKNLGAAGDGGIVVTDDDLVAKRLRMLRNYGETRKHRSEIVGFNRRLDTLQAAVLRVKLPYLDGWNEARRRHAARYDELLADSPVVRPSAGPRVEHVWHLYVVRVPDRDQVRERLAAQGIETGVHYPVPIHLQPAFRDLGYRAGDFPVAERCAGEVLSLPMYPELTDDAIRRVTAALVEATAAPLAAGDRSR